MTRPVENDDFCKFMSEAPRFGGTICTDFDIEEDECALEKCRYSIKWRLCFENAEALD